MPYDIYQSANTSPEDIKKIIQAEAMIIVASQDHLVNPISSIALATHLAVPLVTLTGDCGHISPFCEAVKVKTAITAFLE